MMINSISTLVSPRLLSLFSDNIGGACNRKNEFFGLKAWYYYLPQSDFKGCDFQDFNWLPKNGQSDLVLVMLAVIDDLLIVAGIAAVAFVMIGAFKYVASQGDPEGTAKAQSTIINALLGTAIAITAAVFVNFLGQALGGEHDDIPAGCGSSVTP